MYNQDIHLIVLATFGVFLIFEDLIIITFGVDPYLPYQPAMMLGWVDIVGLNRGVYQLSLILLASIVAFVCWYGLTKQNGVNFFNLLYMTEKLAWQWGLT